MRGKSTNSMYIPKINNKNILFPELSYQINGILFQTQNELGRYRNEKQICDYIEKLLIENNIKYTREFVLPVSFEGEKSKRNIIDFIIDNLIIIEVKARPVLTREDYYQVKRYLISSNKKLGILVNFRDKYLRPRRILNPNNS